MSSELDNFLGAHCSLTKRQIEVLSSQVSARNTLRNGLATEGMDRITRVSEGSHYRVLGQARKNVNEALYTMLLCSRMGILRSDDLFKLLLLINKAPSELDVSSNEVMSLVDALVRKIVMI